MTCSQNVRQRIAGSGPESRIRSRGARGIAGLVDLELGPVDVAREAVAQAHRRARGLEVDELLGIDRREARGVERGAEEREGGGGGLAGVVPALERAHQSRGPEAVRAALPAKGLHRLHGSGSRPARWPSSAAWPRITSLRPGDEVAGVYACTRKDRLLARTGTPYLALELRDRTGALPGRAFKDADVLAGRFERGELVRVRGRVERFRDELQVEVRADRARRVRRPGRVPARRLPRPRRARRLPRAPRARGPRPGVRGAARAAARRRRAARRVAPRAVHARRATTPTSAGCSSTRSRSATLALETCHAAPAAELRPADLRRARPRPRQDARVHLRRGDRASARRAGCSATSCSASGCSTSARPGWTRASGSRSRTACSATTGRDAAPGRRFGSPEALALYRLNALDATVKGALEHGLNLRD